MITITYRAQTKLIILAAVILIALAAGIIYARRTRPEREAVNGRIENISQSAVQEERRIIEHKAQAAERVTVIREQVRMEVEELDPDGLAEFALNEIAIYRGESR